MKTMMDLPTSSYCQSQQNLDVLEENKNERKQQFHETLSIFPIANDALVSEASILELYHAR